MPRSRILLLTLVCMLLALPLLAQTQRKVDGKRATQMQVAPNQPQEGTQPVAIRGGKLLTITHGVIDNGTVVMENGKITAVGPSASVKIPANARVIEANGNTLAGGHTTGRTRCAAVHRHWSDQIRDVSSTWEYPHKNK